MEVGFPRRTRQPRIIGQGKRRWQVIEGWRVLAMRTEVITLAIDIGAVMAYGSTEETQEPVSRDLAGESKEARFQRLYRETGQLVFRRVLRMLGEPADAMDVTQETYLAAWQKGFVLRSRGEALSWRYRTRRPSPGSWSTVPSRASIPARPRSPCSPTSVASRWSERPS